MTEDITKSLIEGHLFEHGALGRYRDRRDLSTREHTEKVAYSEKKKTNEKGVRVMRQPLTYFLRPCLAYSAYVRTRAERIQLQRPTSLGNYVHTGWILKIFAALNSFRDKLF